MQQIFLQGINVQDFTDLLLNLVEEKFNVLVQSKAVHGNKVHSSEQAYLSRTEAARILRISLPTLNEWTKQGKVKAYRIGSRVLYKPDDIDNSLTQAYNFKLNRR